MPHPAGPTCYGESLERKSARKSTRKSMPFGAPSSPVPIRTSGNETALSLIQEPYLVPGGSDLTAQQPERFPSRPKVAHLLSQGGIGLSDYSEGVRYDPSTTTY